MFNEATFREILLLISRNVASLNILVHDVIKYMYIVHILYVYFGIPLTYFSLKFNVEP